MDKREDQEVVEEPIMISMSDYENGVSFDDNSKNDDSNTDTLNNVSNDALDGETVTNSTIDNNIDTDVSFNSTDINTDNISNDVSASEPVIDSTINVNNETDNSLDNNVIVDQTVVNEIDNNKDKKDKKKEKKEKKEKKKSKEKDDNNLDDVSKKKSRGKTSFKFIDSDGNHKPLNKVICLFPSKVISVFTLLVIALLLFYSAYLYLDYNNKLNEVIYSCTPTDISSEKSIDINSSLVQDLYKKVKTNILEDYSQPEWDDTMRLYLAYRQLHVNDFYDSNCTLFRNEVMEPYKCEVKDFTPRAFKVSSLVIEWKKLFGENTPINLGNIKLKNSCIGGFQYIPERDEFVEGYCNYKTTTSFKVTKSLKEATSDGATIVLKESVKYHENEKMEKPKYLRSGTYIYTFKLDMNYNYVLVSKIYDER